MKLNLQELEAMRVVRQKIESEDERYICHCFDWEVYPNLRGAIEDGLEGSYTVESWLNRKVGYRPMYSDGTDAWCQTYVLKPNEKHIPVNMFREHCRMARLAWIDKILENGEIL